MRIVSPPEGAGWAGGDQYLQSINEMLRELESEKKIKVIWFRTKCLFPRWLSLIPGITLVDKILKRVFYSIIGYNFPLPVSRLTRKSFFWIPDLQDIEFPEMFSESQIRHRKKLRKKAISRKYIIYFSSEYAKKTYSNTQSNTQNYGVLRFSTLPEKLRDYSNSPLDCQDCNDNGYLYLPNQWWKHKNHIRTLKAFIVYKSNGGKLHLVLSGKKEDYRWPDYKGSVEELISSNSQDLHDLGMLERSAQLSVLFNSRIVVQTSLYEGWSTTVEECLVSDKVLVVSNLPVLIEQCKDERNVVFVDPLSIDSIAEGLRIAERKETVPRDLYWRWYRFKGDFKQLLKTAQS